jgi:hypothetical protein
MSLESKIDELIAALDRNTAAQDGTDLVVDSTGVPAKRGRKPKITTKSAPPATTATPPASAPAATGPASVVAPAPPAPPPQAVLTQATEVVIKIANEYDRNIAIGILGKVRSGRPGVIRCSDLNPLDWVDVLNEATAKLAELEAAKQAAKATASLV